jgi:pimeloyl-ACP methyl ester carboxylesterase
MKDRAKSTGEGRGIHYWVRRAFLVWAVVSTLWFVNLFRTRDVAPETLADSERVTVRSTDETLVFMPAGPAAGSGLVFIVGGGVGAEAYAPLLRPIADNGYPVFIVRLPYWMAPLESHKRSAIRRVLDVVEGDAPVERWVVAGHSLGGALASRVAARAPAALAALVLIGTSHPKELDLSSSPLAVTKIYATNDGIATPEMIAATRGLLPVDTRWVEIEGGNHSQFGHYGHQLFDGDATISRERQQEITRQALLQALQPFTAPPLQ